MLVLRSVVIAFALFFSLPSFADSVHSCQSVSSADGKSPARLECVAEVTGARVGDTAEIRNTYNYVMAVGKIIKSRGRYVVIHVTDRKSDIKTGFTVALRNNDSIDYWTATKSPY